MNATTHPKPRIVAISLNYESFFDEIYADLLIRLRQKADIQWGKKPSSALGLVQQSPPPTAVLITDAALTEESPDVWDAIIAYVGQGGTAIAMGHFSSFVELDKIRPFFAKAGLDWESGDYHRTTVALNAQIPGIAAERLPTGYSQKARFLKGVHPNALLYGWNETSVTESRVFPTEEITDSTQAAICFAQVRNGKMGYVGDVNAEAETNDVILAMCGLLV